MTLFKDIDFHCLCKQIAYHVVYLLFWLSSTISQVKCNELVKLVIDKGSMICEYYIRTLIS